MVRTQLTALPIPFISNWIQGFYPFFKELIDPMSLFFLVLITALIFRCWRKVSWPLAAFALTGLYLASLGPTSFLLMETIQKGCETRAAALSDLDAVVVLSAGAREGGLWNTGQLAAETSHRLLQGIEVFQTSGANSLVLSGGGTANYAPEAEVMRQTALRLGIPLEKILVEGKSANTRQHAPELQRLGFPRSTRIGLVTSAVHMRRSEMNFRLFFDNLTLLPVGCIDESVKMSPQMLVPGILPLETSSAVFYEILGMIKDYFLGKL